MALEREIQPYGSGIGNPDAAAGPGKTVDGGQRELKPELHEYVKRRL